MQDRGRGVVVHVAGQIVKQLGHGAGPHRRVLGIATEDEVLGIGGENLVGFYSAMKYFQSLDNENNKKFVEAFKAKYGKDAVIGDVAG